MLSPNKTYYVIDIADPYVRMATREGSIKPTSPPTNDIPKEASGKVSDYDYMRAEVENEQATEDLAEVIRERQLFNTMIIAGAIVIPASVAISVLVWYVVFGVVFGAAAVVGGIMLRDNGELRARRRAEIAARRQLGYMFEERLKSQFQLEPASAKEST